MTFIASNGLEVSERNSTVMVDNYALVRDRADALIEFFIHEDDKRRGWWRSKINSDVVIFYWHGNSFGILDTRATVPEALYVGAETGRRDYAEVIEEYLADQKPTPQDGEVWLVSVKGGEPEPALVHTGGNIETRLDYVRMPDSDVELIRRIYPPEDET